MADNLNLYFSANSKTLNDNKNVAPFYLSLIGWGRWEMFG